VTTTGGVRAVVLAGVALVAIAIALEIAHSSNENESLPKPAGQWYSVLAAPYSPSEKPTKGACGVTIGPATQGVAHAVLPCGAKIYIKFGNREVLTQVVDHGHMPPGRDFDVTQKLAKILGLQGTQSVQWRFAR
jgi:hypothetical protein